MSKPESIPGKKLGNNMLIVAWLIALAGLTFVFGVWEEEQYNPNQTIDSSMTGGIKTVILKRNRYGHYLSSGKINNKAAVFLLDTGATNVSVPKNLANKLNLRPGQRYTAYTANGSVEVRGTTIAKLQIGPITLYDVNASINPGLTGDEILLGMSALRQLEFSQNGNELTLTQR